MRPVEPASVVLWSMASVLASCGARSGPGEYDEAYSLGTVATAFDDTLVEIDEGKSARDNLPLPPMDRPPGSPEPQRPPAQVSPEPPVSRPPDVDPPSVPVAPVQPAPDTPPTDTSEPASDPPVAPVDTDPPVAPVDTEAPRLWLYVDAPSSSLIDLKDDAERVTVPRVDAGDEMLKPWSRDGRYLAHFEGTTLYYRDLKTGEVLSANDTGTEMTVHGWVDGFGAFVSYYYEGAPTAFLGRPDGSFVVLGQTPERSLALRASCSPAQNALLYSTAAESVGRVYWVSLRDEVEAGVELLEAEEDVMTRVHWSPDGGWAVFSDAPDGDFVAVADGALESAGPVGAASDMLEFAPTGRSLLNTEPSGVSWVELLAPGDFRITPIDGALPGTPARFSADGSHLYHQATASSGVLREVGDGALGEEYELEGFSSECPLTWTGATRFVYQQCGTEQRGLVEGVLSDGSLELTLLNESLFEHLSFGPSRRCFLNWEALRLDVGSTELPLEPEFTRIAAEDVTFATLSPSDSAVAWVEGGDEVYWLPLNSDCTVSTLPIFVSRGEPVQSLAFVAEWP